MKEMDKKLATGSSPLPSNHHPVNPLANLPASKDKDSLELEKKKSANKNNRPVNNGRLPRHLRDLKPEGIFEPEQSPPAVPVTATMKEEAAALETLNLRPRHILPAAKRREMKYPAEHPSPRLANDFHRYHLKTLKAFALARLPKIRSDKPGGYSFLRWLEKFTGLKKLALGRRRATNGHNITIILSYARRKPTITTDEVAGLIGAKPKVAARYLEKLTDNGDLTRYRHGAKTYYQSVKY